MLAFCATIWTISINLLQTRPQDTGDADEQSPHLSQIPVLQNPQDSSNGSGSGTRVLNHYKLEKLLLPEYAYLLQVYLVHNLLYK